MTAQAQNNLCNVAPSTVTVRPGTRAVSERLLILPKVYRPIDYVQPWHLREVVGRCVGRCGKHLRPAGKWIGFPCQASINLVLMPDQTAAPEPGNRTGAGRKDGPCANAACLWSGERRKWTLSFNGDKLTLRGQDGDGHDVSVDGKAGE